MRIIVDAMGGDNAPEEIVKGAVRAKRELGVDVTLVGIEDKVRACLKAEGCADGEIEVVNASEIITMEDDPSTATRPPQEEFVHGGRAHNAQGRQGQRGRFRGQHRRAPYRGDADRQAHPRHPPRCDGARSSERGARRHAHRLRRERRVYGGVSASVCVYGQLLRQEAHGL